MTVEVRRGSDRFLTREEGRSTRHSFSFGPHYDAGNLGFGPMVCHDDHLLRPGSGFPDHPHAGLEMVTWMLSGALVHADDRGHEAAIVPGTVQVLSAGSGVVHAEVAHARSGPARFVQVWLRPDGSDDESDTDPVYATVPVTLPEGELVPVASGHRLAAAARLATSSATFYVARLPAGASLTLPEDPLQHVFVATGALARSSLAQPLEAGDTFRVTDQPGLQVTAAAPTELLVWTFSSR